MTSGCHYDPFASPLVIVTTLPPPTTPPPDDFPPELSPFLPPEPAELQSSFQKRLDDYNEARKNSVSEPCTFSVCENALIQMFVKFRTYKDTFPQFYPEMIKLPAFQSMIELLKDDDCGSRLASPILLAFEALTDEDVLVRDQRKHVVAFVDSLVEFGAFDVLVSVLGRLSDDDDVVFPAIQTIAQMLFSRPGVAKTAGKKTELINWIMKALGAPKWSEAKVHTLGLLATLLMSENILQLGFTVTFFVNALASLEEEEEEEHDEDDLLDTLFHCLLLLIEYEENKVRFADAGGVRLMIKFIQKDELIDFYYGSAIAAVGIAVKDCPSALEKFLNDDSCLDIAFPASMNKVLEEHRISGKEIEEYLIFLIESLTGGIAKTKKDQLLEKFKENDCEKIAWLMKLFVKYSNKLKGMTNHLKNKQIDQSELYYENLRYGLSTLQSIAVILGYLWSSKNRVINARIETELSHHKLEKKHVLDILSTYRDNIGNAGESVESATKENPDQGLEQDVDITRLQI